MAALVGGRAGGIAEVPQRVASRCRLVRRPALVAAVMLPLASCEADAPPPTLETANGVVELESSTPVREVSLERDSAGREFVDPQVVEAVPGDLVRFTSETLDTHALSFLTSRLTTEQRRFLEESGQESSTPILQRGATWVLTLEGAPAGAYPYLCLIHEARGMLRVRESG